MKRKKSIIFTIDLEEWFHILDLKNAPDIDEWDNLENRIEKNTEILLNILDEYNVNVTFFVLGWVAKKYPKLILKISEKGHEIASHGCKHILYHKSNKTEVISDIRNSKEIIENLTGKKVLGFRAPGFSITKGYEWILDEILKAGYKYDSSIFPAIRFHGGHKDFPNVFFKHKNELIEFPIAVYVISNKIKIPIGGGGYFRLYPLKFQIKFLNMYINKYRIPPVFYIHPRDIDYFQPRLKMNLARKFRTYVGLKKSLGKLKHLLDIFDFYSIESFLEQVNEKNLNLKNLITE